MNKIKTIIIGIIGLCIATFIGCKFIGIEFNIGNLYHTLTGIILGVCICEKE
tara:strand:+ start:5766 stop:5921 length:156 start_codon:yes stop_codon:yes gene_type:complete